MNKSHLKLSELGIIKQIKMEYGVPISPVVDSYELATTFLDDQQLANQGLQVVHSEWPDGREPACMHDNQWFKSNPFLAIRFVAHVHVCVCV